MEQTVAGFERFTISNVATIFLISALYLIVSFFLIGFKPEQLVLIAIFCTLYFGTATSRKFIIGFSIFIVYWIVFDYMKAFPNYRVNYVHIGDLYNCEKDLFGIHHGKIVLTPNEFLLRHQNPFLNALSGFLYLCWVPVPLLFASYLFFRKRGQFLRFALTFFLVNILGFIIYYAYPAAPPWYIQYFGSTFHANTPGNPAGLSRFDHMFHVEIFKSIYAQSSNVFAAMPSLHAAYPVIVLYYGLKNKFRIVNIIFALILAGIWFSAIYNCHHYVVDILAGLFCAILVIILFNWFIKNINWAERALNKFEKVLE